MSTNTSGATATGSIEHVSVKPPPFYSEDPFLWFAQLESQFALAKVITDETKYSHVVANLPAATAMEVRDILAAPPQADKYSTIKQALIDRLSLSESKRLQKLLHDEELGDRTPSQLLRRLKCLSNSAVSDDVLRNIWIARLPSDIQKILTVSKGGLDDLAVIADHLQELHPSKPSISATSLDSDRRRSMDDLEQRLTDQIAALSAQLNALKSSDRSRSRNRSNSRTFINRGQSTSRGLCWYHNTFGSKARKCTAPCNFTSGNDPGSR